MSGALRAILLVLALFAVGLVGLYLSGGSRSAARDSARCLDPRQPGCEPGDIQKAGNHPAAGLVASGSWKPGGAPVRPRDPKAGAAPQTFAVPQAAPKIEIDGAHLSGGARPQGGASGSPADALRAALTDVMRDMPEGAATRRGRGVPGDPEAGVVEYLGPAGALLYRVVLGRDRVVVMDYERGLRHELDRDGTPRGDTALADPAEPATSRARRLTRRWGLPASAAAGLGRSAGASAAYVDLRRSGLSPQAALRLARPIAAPLPPFPAWSRQAADEIAGLDEGVARSYYTWLSNVPVLSRLVAGVLGEPPLAVARRFGFDGHLAQQFMEGATGEDLLLGRRLPQGALPARVLPSTPLGGRTLRALVGEPQTAVTLPLSLCSLQEALERPEVAVRALPGLPPAYPYLLLSEQVDGRQRPLLVSTATLLSFSAPLSPDDPDAEARLAVLPVDAPVALLAALPVGTARDLLDQGAAVAAAPLADFRLRAFALAGPLRERLHDDRAPLSRLTARLSPAAGRPPAAYFAGAPFLYGALSEGQGERARVLRRHGVPTGALLHLHPEQNGQQGLPALPETIPADASAALRGALLSLFSTHGRTSASVSRHRQRLAQSAAGRDVLDGWALLQAQLAVVGLAAGCAAQGRCPLPGLSRPADATAQLAVLQGGFSAERRRILLAPIERVDAAELSDRMGELLLHTDHVAAALEARRRFQPKARDAAALGRILAYVHAATGEAPRPDPEGEGYLVRDLQLPRYQEHLAAWERGAPLPAPEELDGEALTLLRDRGEVPATLGELVQRHGAALLAARPTHLPAGQARARVHRRVLLRIERGLSHLSVAQTMDPAGHLRDVEVLVEHPGGELTGYSYDGDGRLVTGKGSVPLGGSGCLSCHRDGKGEPLLSPLARWQPGAGGVTWLTPVVAAELQKTAAARRAAELP